MKLHFITFEVKGPRSISKVNYPKYLKQKSFGDLYEITLHYIWGPRSISKVNYPKYLKLKSFGDLYEITLHYIWGLRSKVNFQGQLSKVSKAKKFRWPLWNYTSLHLRSKVQGQLSKVSKAKNFGDLYFHENTLQAAQKNSTVNTIQLKYDVSCKKLHFFTCEVQGQLSKEKQKISVTSMKLHLRSKVNFKGQLSFRTTTSHLLSLKSSYLGICFLPQ